MNYEFLLLPRLKVSGANLQAAWWCIAPPGPTAALGFAHNLARKLGTRELGVGLVHHDAEYNIEDVGDFTVYPQQRRGSGFIDKDDYAGRLALSMQPTVTGHLEVSLIIKFPVNTIDMNTVATMLESARYGGGLVTKHGKTQIKSSMKECQAALRSGFGVHDRSELLVSDTSNTMERFLELTNPLSKEKLPWLIPALMGYQAITPLAARNRVRGDYKHAYCEPLIGLTQYVPLREADVPLWTYCNNEKTYFVQTQGESK